jgi:hypothetical protein
MSRVIRVFRGQSIRVLRGRNNRVIRVFRGRLDPRIPPPLTTLHVSCKSGASSAQVSGRE